MSGRNDRMLQFFGSAEKPSPLEVAVAVDTGVGGRARLVGGNKPVDNLPLKVPGEIDDIIGKPEPSGDRPRVVYVVQRAAGMPLSLDIFPVKQPHRDSDQIVSVAEQERRRSA